MTYSLNWALQHESIITAWLESRHKYSWMVDGVLCLDNIFKEISGWVLTCGNAHSVTLSRHSANQLFPILLMPSAWLGSGNYKFVRHCFDLTMRIPWSPKPGDGCSTHSVIRIGADRGTCLIVSDMMVWEFYSHLAGWLTRTSSYR